MDFKGHIPQSNLVPWTEVNKILHQKGSPFEIQNKCINGRTTKIWKNLPESVRDAWCSSAKEFSKRICIVAEGERFTYAQIQSEAILCSYWLSKEFGVRKGDRVSIVCRNCVEFVVAYYATHLLGAVPALVNAFLEGQQMYDCIRDVGSRVVIADYERWEKIKAAGKVEALFRPVSSTLDGFTHFDLEQQGISGLVVFPREKEGLVPKARRDWASGFGSGVRCWEELKSSYSSTCPSKPPSVKIYPEDIGSILFTSGTTGTPKGVFSTHRQFLSNAFSTGASTARSLLRRGLPLPPPSTDETAPRSILLIPLFHSTGIQSGLVPRCMKGSMICLLPKYTVDDAARMIQREKVDTVLGIGFMVRELCNSKHDLSTVIGWSHGGSSSAKELPFETQRKTPGAFVGQGYGLTEVNGAATGLAGDDYLERPTSAGIPGPVTEVMVVDVETGVEVPRGTPGELWIKGPQVACGYWNRPKATAEVFHPDGWFRSGDIAKMDEEGYIYILDRSKHIIVRGGENISGTEVENAVYEEARIIDCCAVPLPCPRLGERVAVVCVPRPEFQQGSERRPTREDVVRACSKVLPKQFVPEYVWIRDEPLERNANGKVDKSIVKRSVLEKANREGFSFDSRPSKL
ncbi:acetyl-CoA synthetase-like protein [Violaceomyces palustris]|uniref:Acetyl-CoA synthetase-like protein n=1 Tax=Violaceomyces palustris TaxID=1673888 RepID=A0ACD0NNE9_9BASI|nr:acetyl-CoA synthetase-like protein [Violaceomyces palustris]